METLLELVIEQMKGDPYNWSITALVGSMQVLWKKSYLIFKETTVGQFLIHYIS